MISWNKLVKLWAAFLVMPVLGCAEAFLRLGDALGNVGDGLAMIGTTLSPLDSIDLNEVFEIAPRVSWMDDTAEITDASQPDVQAYLQNQLGQEVQPITYTTVRIFNLGPSRSGDLIELQSLQERVTYAYLYDDQYKLIPAGSMRDFEGRSRTLNIPITHDTPVTYIRLDLEFPSETGETIVRLTQHRDTETSAVRPQTVVLHFGGQENIVFRNDYLIPTKVSAFDNPLVQEVIVDQFKTIYQSFNLTVLTDSDPTPGVPYCVIYIGFADPPIFYLGLAEIADGRNAYQDDKAVVDLNHPVLQMAPLLGTDRYGRAVGLIAAHEMGHLLGLLHVADPDDLMTGARGQGIGSDVGRLLRRQLKTAPLIFATADLQHWTLGYQDGIDNLLEILGPAE